MSTHALQAVPINVATVDRAELNRQNARRYPAAGLSDGPDDELLNISAVCVEFPDLNYWTFHRHTKKLLTAHDRYYCRPNQNGDGRSEETFLKSDIIKLREPPFVTAINGRYEMKDGPVRISFMRAQEELGTRSTPMARDTLNKLVTDGLIAFEWWTSPSSKSREQVCFESALSALKKELKERDKATEREGPDGAQILIREAIKKLQPNWRKRHRNGKLKAARFSHWAKNGCNILGGEKITIYNNATWMLKADFEKLNRAMSLGPGCYLIDGIVYGGKDAAADKGVTERKMAQIHEKSDKAKRLLHCGPNGQGRRVVPLEALSNPPADPPKFDGVYDDGRVNLTKAAHDSGLSRNFLKKCIRNTTYLSEGKLRSKKQRRLGERFHGSGEHTVLPGDLKRLRDGIGEATLRKAPNGFNIASEVLQKLLQEIRQQSSLELEILCGALLKEGRENGHIAFWQPPQPISGRNGRTRRPWFYDLDDAIEYIRNGPPAPNKSPAATLPISATDTDAASGHAPHTAADDERNLIVGDAVGGTDGRPVILGAFGKPAIVNGILKDVVFYGPYTVIRALLDAGDVGLSKDELEAVNSAARRILKQLKKDADWNSVIDMPGPRGRGKRYRIR
jgi:hypothetical protein